MHAKVCSVCTDGIVVTNSTYGFDRYLLTSDNCYLSLYHFIIVFSLFNQLLYGGFV